MRRFGGFCKLSDCKRFIIRYGPLLTWWALIWGATVFFWLHQPLHRPNVALSMSFLLLTAMVVAHVSSVISNRRHRKDLQQLENKLRRSRELFDIFMAHLPALAFIKDRDGRYLFVNAVSRDMLQAAPEKIIGRTDADIWPGAVAEKIGRCDRQVLEDRQALTAIEEVTFGEQARHYLVTRFPLLDNGQEPRLAGVACDISEKIQAEEEKAGLESLLIQTQKMEAIGTLAGGIAHDFNNMLSAILGNVELAQLDTPTDSGVQNYLAQVLKATHRAKELVRQILAFSRKSAPKFRVIDPLPTIVEALEMLRAILPATIEIRSDLTTHKARILADSTQLQQVVMNLCTNGAQAMEDSGGILSVVLQKRQLNDATARDLGLAPGSYLALSVCDTGLGMSRETLQRIFDPFFTTKERDKGTGMGLAMVYGIVKACSGSINITSEPGKGTACNVFLPIVSGEANVSRENREPLPTGRESILFVDDEPFLVDLGNRMLSRLGYRVVACNSGSEALNQVELDPHRFDLVITDYTMPDMTGAHLAQKLQDIRADLPIIMCSGHCGPKTYRASSQSGIAAFVMKPLTIRDLAYTVRRVLDRPAAQSAAQPLPGWCRTAPN